MVNLPLRDIDKTYDYLATDDSHEVLNSKIKGPDEAILQLASNNGNKEMNSNSKHSKEHKKDANHLLNSDRSTQKAFKSLYSEEAEIFDENIINHNSEETIVTDGNITNHNSEKADVIDENIRNQTSEETEVIAKNIKSHIPSEREIVDENAYTCKICGRKFKHHAWLVNHLRIHTRKKVSICDVCGMSFIHRYLLKSHMNVHTAGKTTIHVLIRDRSTSSTMLKKGNSWQRLP